jgi:predicted metal-dependent HD superfamily phosphohydrolase
MSEIVTSARAYVQNLLNKELSTDHIYHNWDHTSLVYDEAMSLANDAALGDEDREILSLAALFHDTGFVHTFQDHEEASKKIASAYLSAQNYPVEKITKVVNAIDATKMPHLSSDKVGALLQDADLSNLGRDDWEKFSELIRNERANIIGEKISDADWENQNNIFLKDTLFQTREGKLKYDEGKKKNREELKEKLKKDKKKGASMINSNRTAEMLFKTALRNHINLTQIADNKANIMLSINALILTFALPTLLRKDFDKDWFFILPAGMIGVTCVISIVYAALSTQPGKFKGRFNLSDIKAGKGSLFFFGNFYNTSLDEYIEGMKVTLTQEQNLDEAAIMDLYFLGKSLGRKFNMLRKCYSFFLIGITLSSLLFILGFILGKG